MEIRDRVSQKAVLQGWEDCGFFAQLDELATGNKPPDLVPVSWAP